METITAISKMIASGDIPKEVYDKYLSKTKLGFCTKERIEEIITKEATQDDKKILQILKEKKVDLNFIFCYLNSFDVRKRGKVFWVNFLHAYNTKNIYRLTAEDLILIVEWLKEKRSE